MGRVARPPMAPPLRRTRSRGAPSGQLLRPRRSALPPGADGSVLSDQCPVCRCVFLTTRFRVSSFSLVAVPNSLCNRPSGEIAEILNLNHTCIVVDYFFEFLDDFFSSKNTRSMWILKIENSTRHPWRLVDERHRQCLDGHKRSKGSLQSFRPSCRPSVQSAIPLAHGNDAKLLRGFLLMEGVLAASGSQVTKVTITRGPKAKAAPVGVRRARGSSCHAAPPLHCK